MKKLVEQKKWDEYMQLFSCIELVKTESQEPYKLQMWYEDLDGEVQDCVLFSLSEDEAKELFSKFKIK